MNLRHELKAMNLRMLKYIKKKKKKKKTWISLGIEMDQL